VGFRHGHSGLGLFRSTVRRVVAGSRACHRADCWPRLARPPDFPRPAVLGLRLGLRRVSLVTELDDKPFLEALLRAPNRSFRRYDLIFKDGIAQFERDPICEAFDEILEEMFGQPPRPCSAKWAGGIRMRSSGNWRKWKRMTPIRSLQDEGLELLDRQGWIRRADSINIEQSRLGSAHHCGEKSS
jgi:hypothetical protein